MTNIPELDLSKHFVAPWQPVRHTLGYRLMVGVVSVAMVCLPLIYLAIMGGVGYLVYLHVTRNTYWFENAPGGRSIVFIAIGFAAPVIAGLCVVLFMLKPLFAPPAKREPGLALEPFEEARLYGFVDMISSMVGAPNPKKIEINSEVNAAATFRRGWISLFVPGDLVLIVGTPIVSGMNVSQFAGVLAHEFGHFAQGAGMRSTFLIFSITGWFARAAYQRDGWDEKLAEVSHAAGHWTISLMVMFAQLCIWVTRMILIVMLWIARLLGAAMLRQMEYDADRYECRLVGSKVYEETSRKMHLLSAAVGTVEGTTFEMWKKRKELPDDVAGLIASAAERLPPETVEALNRRVERDKTGWLDTHPSTKARVKAAHKLEEPGILHCDLPATMLFRDFDAASTKASYGHFQERLKGFFYDATFIKTKDILRGEREQRAREQRAERFIGFRPPTWRPLYLGASKLAAPADPRKTMNAVKAARDRLAAMKGTLAGHAEEYRKATEQIIDTHKARVVFELGFNTLPKDMGLKYQSGRHADEDARKCMDRAATSAAVIDEATELAAARVHGLLQLLCVKGIEKHLPDAPARGARAAKLVPVLAGLRDVHKTVQELREEVMRASTLNYAFASQTKAEAGKKKLRTLADSMQGKLQDVRQKVGAVPYPFGERTDVFNLGERLVGATPGWREYQEIYDAAYACVERFPNEHMMVLGELVEIAESVEKAVVKGNAPMAS